MLVHFIKQNLPQQIYRLFFFAILFFYIRIALEYGAILIKRYAGYTIEDAINKHGIAIIILFYSLSFTFYLNIPVVLFNFLGLFLYNPFDRRVERYANFDRGPFICFRVVTRGLYLKLVTNTTMKNIEICKNVGLKNFKFEIVSDSALKFPFSSFVREVIVPTDYNTPNGTLFKARALHYCLKKNVNTLSRDDWIVHLDEETLLTEAALNGISNFVSNPNSNIGQGIISYAECGVENWLTTLMEGQREAADYGLHRLAFQFFHRPVFGFKGSFMVIKAGIEEKIGFDFGPKECIAEDLRFALAAWHSGYRFDFVKGVMKEKGTFSITDFIKQRKRWFVGHFQIIWGTSIPLYCKWALMPMNVSFMLSWINILNYIISISGILPLANWQIYLFVLVTFGNLFLLQFGNFMSICHKRYGFIQRMFIAFSSQFLWPLISVLYSIAALQGIRQRNTISFYIVQKETKGKKDC